MTLLSRKADYALLILSYLHQRPEGGNARAIAERFGLSRPFVANILKELCHQGYVASHRGVKGGYVLQKSADEITLAEVLEAIGERFRLTLCNSPLLDEEPCSLESDCPMRAPLADIHRRIVAVLSGVTLAQMFPASGSGLEMVPLGMLTGLPMSPVLCGNHTQTTNQPAVAVLE